MELKELQSAEPEVIDVPLLFDAEGNPTDGFKVVGMNSKQYQEADRKWKLINFRKSAGRRRAVDAATEAGAAEMVDMIARREAAILSACIVEIYGFTFDGVPAVLSQETLNTIFEARPAWRQKVLAGVESEQVFIQTSSGA